MHPFLEDSAKQSSVSRARLSGACPSFFKACCRDAAHAMTRDGIAVGYDHPGYHLMLHVESLCPYDVEDEEWEPAIGDLRAAVERTDDAAVLEWFCRWLPRCMELVPKRRRGNFLKGVYRCAIQSHEWLSEEFLEFLK
jgi:hypothetical protein